MSRNPAAWQASTWNKTGFVPSIFNLQFSISNFFLNSLISFPILIIGWIVPISLLAYITDMSLVFSLIAFRNSSNFTNQALSTLTTIALILSAGLSTDLCSMAVVIISPFLSPSPKIARELASEPELVKIISSARAPKKHAILKRALSTSSRADLPRILKDDGLPYCFSALAISFATRRSTGVAAALSRYISLIFQN